MSADVVARDMDTVRSLTRTVDAVAERDVAAMEKSLRSSIGKLPLEEVLETYPGIRELLREVGAGCEGCRLLHLATLEEVFKCYRIDGESFLEGLPGIDK